MKAPSVQTLLGAVQRRLWRAQFVVALRRALWGSSALVLLAAMAQLTGLTAPLTAPWTAPWTAPLITPVSALLFALGALWLVLLARAAWQRPGDATCALWADRHLGGASAYTTWLETVAAPGARANAQAVLWLQQWTEQRLPESLRVLNESRVPTHLARPLLVALVSSALAAIAAVLQPPALTSAPVAVARQSPDVSSPAGKADAAALLPQTPDTAPLVSEIANALRAADGRPAAARGGAQDGPSAGPGQAGDEQAPGSAPAANPTAVDHARSGQAAGDPPVAAPAAAGAGNSSSANADANAGREAGDSRDLRAGVGVSRPLGGPIPVQRSAARENAATPELQADMNRLAAYEPDASMPGRAAVGGPAKSAAKTAATPAAATPPLATDDLRLSPTQSSYVQAWMKASSRYR